jgi:hypothetical protein
VHHGDDIVGVGRKNDMQRGGVAGGEIEMRLSDILIAEPNGLDV